MKTAIWLIDQTVKAVAALTLAASTLMILVNVFNRYVVLGWLRDAGTTSDIFQSIFDFADGILAPFSATADEVPGLLLVWISFLGAYLAYRKGGHIAFELIVEHLPANVGKAVTALTDLSIITFLALLFYQSVRMIIIDGSTEIETAEIAQGWFMAILPLASVLLIFALILDILGRTSQEETE
ncbi:TRAP transporter small permease [Terasakiella pusilla]|uniref:TRAP transporter small permease n=1 Tax=Terasakiella pusilla TaxID=64973 RepID=UPI003AA96E59